MDCYGPYGIFVNGKDELEVNCMHQQKFSMICCFLKVRLKTIASSVGMNVICGQISIRAYGVLTNISTALTAVCFQSIILHESALIYRHSFLLVQHQLVGIFDAEETKG